MLSLKTLQASPALKRYLELIKGGETLAIQGLWDSPKTILAGLAEAATGKRIVVVTGGTRESRLYDDFGYFGIEAREFPAWETLPSEGIPPSPDIVGERYALLRDPPQIILCPLQACLQRVISPKRLEVGSWTLSVGDEVPFEELVEILQEGGYQRRPVAADKGEYSVRGGIVDIFPVHLPDPFRVEFWGDAVDGIRKYDPVGQKSISKVDSFSFTPAQELEILKEGETASLFDYLGPETLLIFDDLPALEERFNELPDAVSESFISLDQLMEETKDLQRLYWSSTPAGVKPWKNPFKRIGELFGDDDLVSALGQSVELGLALTFVCENEGDEEHLKDLLKAAKVVLPRDTRFERGYLSSGFALEDIALIPMTEITHRYRVRRQKQRSTHHTAATEYTELVPGDLVVHFHNGIGRFAGTEVRKDHEGREVEFIVLEYAERGKLFIPVSQSHLVSKYIGATHEAPKLSQLGTGRWAKMRVKTEAAIRDYAAQLLQMQAERQVAPGFPFPPDDEEMERFERLFPYEETDDQIGAIAAVKADMEQTRPMDRLVCGDVGYGKTEVAMRAAFKAAQAGKQVAILVPTTVLAMQHFENFTIRMENTAINVGVLSRFRKPKEQRETLKAVAEGQIDILIGTHRLIGKDVHFKELGLIIIDEEQKFGVRVKEKLRNFKAGVDCLTLTATPIPRTLYLSLMGTRDLSVINTPPQDRLPIKTVISEADEEKMRAALQRELARDGQAYVVHNRVETIYEYADSIRMLVPHAEVIVGHGQMEANALDEVFHAFREGRADILVATTIVESGLDIPNANTILIDRADRYGLADLYQLRGRVGRWTRRAYAYFLLPKQRVIRETAEKRLNALLEIGGYGGGMRLAMRDLELRGAGNLLGTEQSGSVSQVGFHLYCKLLKRTIDALQGRLPHTLTETKLEFPQDARLPKSYIEEPAIRMELYQRLGTAETAEAVNAVRDELIDRFGPLPEPAIWLTHLMRIRVAAAAANVTTLKMRKLSLVIERPGDTRTILIGEVTDPTLLEEKVLSALTK